MQSTSASKTASKMSSLCSILKLVNNYWKVLGTQGCCSIFPQFFWTRGRARGHRQHLVRPRGRARGHAQGHTLPHDGQGRQVEP
jgi:hypothetical protein